ncbi:sodium-dependent noradrenaline transporter-like [Galleria mellonella]|uniref:Sodium-dependent noradrenaline transporter-like n=1 Tax=Galleria mellonella TaxID=7137 RepID=A0ABM3N2W1_GALME|nr:sodium-dependent noradrenaline transporter-like [Galleria mellonella]
MDGKIYTDIKCRWKTYSNYRLILWAWMMNEISIMASVIEISHNNFYIHTAIHILAVIFIGIPLVYSEICIAQYTNCDVISMWNFFPLFRNVGYGAVFLVILKTVYLTVLSSWYLQYSFYAAIDPPPWFTCDDYNDTKCMVKRINVSIFQHCLETQILFDDDCGMKTASNCFFERMIGDNNTMMSKWCVYQWKSVLASFCIMTLLFILSMKKEKFILIIVKILAFYLCLVIILLLCVALSTSGAWHTKKIALDWNNYNFKTCYTSITRGFLSVGTGYGIIGFLSRDASFRSPSMMTSISVPLYSVFVTTMYALVAFNGIKTMSYYHGEEENVIEMGTSSFFLNFASISEILSYFDAMPIWGFIWFSSGFVCLFVNLWILYIFLLDSLFECLYFMRKYPNLCCMLLSLFIFFFSWPFFCSDLTGSLTDTTELLQIVSSLLFSLSLYWIYGYRNHNIDIIFMIGIKASYFWKIAWVINPLLLLSILYAKSFNLQVTEYSDSFYINYLSIHCDVLLFYVILGTYFSVFIIGLLIELFLYYRYNKLRNILFPTENWGPKEAILFKSRKLFVPEIMTTEFLYRQIRIHGYCKKQSEQIKENNTQQNTNRQASTQLSIDESEWSAFMSN